MRSLDSLPQTWDEIAASKTDWDASDPKRLGAMLVAMHIIRAFEEQLITLANAGVVHGPVHTSIGQEAGAVGAMAALAVSDKINGSHRAHHQFISKLLRHAVPDGLDPRAEFPESVITVMRRTMSEIMGLKAGYCGGRGGSMHLRNDAAGVIGTNAIVGGGVPLAAGSAFAQKRSGDGAVTVTFFGDGACNIGAVLETMNLAAAWKLPLCFFIENNHYAVGTSVEAATGQARFAARGSAFGIEAFHVDGMDPVAVYKAMDAACAIMRAGDGPTLIECDTYRYFHQNGGLPGSAYGYRTKEEEEHWRSRDALIGAARNMQDRGLLTPDEEAAVRERAVAAMAAIADELTETVDGRLRIVPALWPDPETVDVGIRGDLSELSGLRTAEPETFNGTMAEQRFVDVIAAVTGRRMEEDSRIVVMGEEVNTLGGGTNGATKGLVERFGDRIIGTPICEQAFLGLGVGAAMDGRIRPIVEFMYSDFMWVAADVVFNQAGKARHMFGGDKPVPLVLRSKVAMGTGYGAQHSMDPAGVYALSPGWRIVAPSNPFDYVGLMNAALACEDPVLVLEHTDLYPMRLQAPVDDLDYIIPLGKARVAREGSAVTVLTYLNMVQKTLDAVEETGIDAEVIDLRSLDRASLDWETIEASVRKTNRVLVVEQGVWGTSYGTILGDSIQRRLFDWLDQPVQRVTGTEAGPNVSKVFEAAALADTGTVSGGLRAVMRDSGL